MLELALEVVGFGYRRLFKSLRSRSSMQVDKIERVKCWKASTEM